MSHTPGPWQTEGYKELIVNGSDGVTLAMCPGDTMRNGIENVQANAKLIASAPELLDIAKACLHQLSTDSDLDDITGAEKYRELVDGLKQAIYKADPSFPPVRDMAFA